MKCPIRGCRGYHMDIFCFFNPKSKCNVASKHKEPEEAEVDYSPDTPESGSQENSSSPQYHLQKVYPAYTLKRVLPLGHLQCMREYALIMR
ncbi:hypothetical protein B484DRAFT_404875 [Ochromonadaceae sp. CCMP2298]|nr:hypothetical protein B484DRAFT_404875 [Ochromonadaceae sp. CCMP2298]